MADGGLIKKWRPEAGDRKKDFGLRMSDFGLKKSGKKTGIGIRESGPGTEIVN